MANRERTKKREGAAFPQSSIGSGPPSGHFGFWSGLHGHQSCHFGFWCGLHRHQSSHFGRWCGLQHGHHNGHRPFQSLVRPGNSAAQKTGENSVVTRMSCRGRPVALLSPPAALPRGSSSWGQEEPQAAIPTHRATPTTACACACAKACASVRECALASRPPIMQSSSSSSSSSFASVRERVRM